MNKFAYSILIHMLIASILIGIQFGWLMGVTAWFTIAALRAKIPSRVNPVHVKVMKDDQKREES